MDFVDYYKQLGVSRGATQAEIKRAYRKLSRTYHPDVNKDPTAEDRFKEIAEAYEVLGDKDNRVKYDRFGAAWKAARDRGDQGAPAGFEGFDVRGGPGGADFAGATGFSEFFERLFGRDGNPFAGAGAAGPAGYAGSRPRRGPHHEAALNLSVEDAYRGGRREVTLSDPQTGKSRKYVVTIPKGVRHGQKIRLKGQGGLGVSGGPPGDILLAIKLESSSKVRLQGSDVHTSLQVSPWVAALGGQARLKTLDGEVKVTVPAGSSSGVRIRLKGKGYPRKSGDPGDLYAEIRIMVPKKLSRRERELFEDMAEESKFEPDRDD